MKPEPLVVGLGLAMACSAAVLTIATVGSQPALDLGTRWWILAPAFLIAERFVSHVELRNQVFSMSLSEAVLLIAVLTLAPEMVIAARLLGSAPAIITRRMHPEKLLFNIALFAFEASMASALFHLVFGSPREDAWAWGLGALSVLVSVVTIAAIVAGLISRLDTNRPQRLLVKMLVVQVATTSLALSLTVIGVAAVVESASNAGYLLVVLTGTAFALRSQTATTQRASDFQNVGRFSAQLLGLGSTKDVLQVALEEAVVVMRASNAAVLDASNERSEPVVLEATNDIEALMPRLTNLTSGPVESATLLSDLDGYADGDPDGLVAPLIVAGRQSRLVVWGSSTEIGGFDARSVSLFESMAGQVQVALSRAGLIDQLEHDAHHDALTKLLNRRGFVAQTSGELSCGALFMLDLDRFKDINDTLGHPTGDRALELVAARLDGVRTSDAILARFGGDEFALFDPHCMSADEAIAVAEGLIAAIEQPIVFDDLSLRLGVSIGVALAPIDGEDASSLLSHADQALHEAKRQQIGWQFYDRERDTNDPRRLDLLSGLRDAVNAREFDVWYQPKIRIADGAVIGAEALARWQHPRYGFVPPDEFIALAEGAGLMRDLTDAVFQRVVNDLQAWGDEGPASVAVNLSTRNLLDEQLPRRLDDMIQLAGIGRDRIAFEVTETSMMLDRDRVAGLLGELHYDLGFDIAIDDYGTGYSSLAYLRELPVNQLKIDRAFVTNLDLDEANEVIVRSTIDLGHNLGLTIVAEGVEREEELQLLGTLGCEYAQGYYISRPLPADRFIDWMRHSVNQTAVATQGPSSTAV